MYNVASVNTMQYIVLIINPLIKEGWALFFAWVLHILCVSPYPYIESRSLIFTKLKKVRQKFVTSSCWLVVVLMQCKVPQVEYTHCFAQHQSYKNSTSLIHISTPLAQIININLPMRSPILSTNTNALNYTDFNYCSKLFIAYTVSPLY